MRVALYVRVSTDEQTVENQKRDLLRYCEARNWEVAEMFEDVGISGATHERPALTELMEFARKGKCDAVLVWRFDRFARSVTHLLEALQEFKALDIEFISYSEGIDTSTPTGKMVFVFLAAVGEFERSVIQSRVRSGIARAQADGVKFGRPRVAIDIRKALELRESGLGYKQIAKALGIPRSTLFRTLQAIPKTLAA